MAVFMCNNWAGVVFACHSVCARVFFFLPADTSADKRRNTRAHLHSRTGWSLHAFSY